MADNESYFKVLSCLNGEISQLSLLQRSLLFAELSAVAYMNEDRAKEAVKTLGFTKVKLFERQGAEAYIFESEWDCVVAFRGTEPTQLNDIKADLKASMVISETVGKVHKGFRDECDELWPMLEKVLRENTKLLYFCGHSLGAGMATICASRCRLSSMESNLLELFTYGSPRVGNPLYIKNCYVEHIRWVNNNDVVTRVPPRFLGYNHVGDEMYLNAHGKVRTITGWQRTKDRIRGMWMGLKHGNLDNFSDHLVSNYIRFIHQAVQEEQATTSE
ncbi:MAG: lipase family protein [Mariprofundaceae bacterium]|nr:lipase family protein [Mariprofundaceae bacterium]